MKFLFFVIFLGVGLIFPLASLSQVENAKEVVKKTKVETKRGDATSGRNVKSSDVKNNEASVEFRHTLWRDLDLRRSRNAVLSFAKEEGRGLDLFRIIMRSVAEGEVPAYEFQSGREAFTPDYLVDIAEIFNRFRLSEDALEEPARYYLIEDWEFDNRTQKKRLTVEAICPVLEMSGDLGENMRYPLFWVKYSDLRPYLKQTLVSVSELDSRPTHTLDEYFALSLYDGEIYKSANPRNLTLAELHRDSASIAQARDSIEKRLSGYGGNLWLPTRDEYLASREGETGKKVGETKKVAKTTKRAASSKRVNKAKKVKPAKSGESNTNAVKSVRRRRR